jgi:erythromycin esterase-like protein
MGLKRQLVITAVAAILSAAPAAAATETQLDTLIRRTSHRIELRDGSLAGPGAEWLATRTAGARFVMLGEDHGNAGIARFAAGLARQMGEAGPLYTAVEVDPLIATELDAMLRGDDLTALRAFLERDGHALSVPFFTWTEEAEFLREALRHGPAGTQSVWGLDQAFIGAAYVWLDRIAALATTPDARAQAVRLAARAKADIMSFLGTVDVAELERLRNALTDPAEGPVRRLAGLLARSARIYGPFVRGGGSVFAANLDRETLMKQLFREHAEAAAARDGTPPRVLLKFGANHLMRGLSHTHVPSLGNFLYETVGVAGDSVFSVLAVLGPGSEVVDFMGQTTLADESFAKSHGFLLPHVSEPGMTLIDLGPWKDRPRRWADIPRKAADLIWAFDALLIVSGAGPATFVVPR